VLQAHVAVKQAVVVGAPHPRLGEVCYAYVQLEDGEAEDDGAITAWCKTRLADYKVPRTIEFLDDFPRTTTGKIQRFILADKVRLAAEQQA
jgi:fatty-acyl-CoA synthase